MNAETLQTHFDTGGPEAVVTYIQSQPDLTQRRELYPLAQRHFGRAEHPDFDALILIVHAGIAEGVRQAAAENETDEANKRTDFANILSYNLAADLAECWPGDVNLRERRHLEAGLAAAEACLKWREELRKGPKSFSLAWWAKGVHCLSLGRPAEAADCFRHSLTHAIQAAIENSEPTDPETDFSVVLAQGYLGLALEAAGDPEGAALFDQACRTFENQLPLGGEIAEDAQIGIDQLRTMRSRLETSRRD